jgi:hypothetical protein
MRERNGEPKKETAGLWRKADMGFFGATLVVSTRIPAVMMAIPMCSILLLITSITDRAYPNRRLRILGGARSGCWFKKITRKG